MTYHRFFPTKKGAIKFADSYENLKKGKIVFDVSQDFKGWDVYYGDMRKK